ncbi:MAG: CpXC domain-containing protein [Oscillochloridaceae bacterium]|nr:CpXC domain-containing protein [Chloroflexaceae bacterium]MDW8391174.1 CpXC domain-containing protein [Oscillochloridaceae bacterium]
MPAVAPQPVQITCPACGVPFRANLYTLVDAAEQPALKTALLSGQLNVAVCPNCGSGAMLGAPLIYHDPRKQLCLVYFPQELNTPPEEQERFIGEATSFLLRSLPADAPRAYLLAPRRFLTLASLLDTILEADGVSRETLERQRAYVDLISELATAVNSEERFNALVARRRADFTPEFFATLEAFIQALPDSQAESRTLLLQVHERLNNLIGEGGAAAAADEVRQAIERLLTIPDDQLEQAVAELRPVLDYSFFQAWTERIEAAQAAGQADEAARLTERRARILALIERLDRETQALFEAGNALLAEVLEAPDPLAALHERAERVGEGFMIALSANAAAAQRSGREELAQRLEQLAAAAVEIIQSRLSPEERFINELLLAETPKEATALLRKNVAKITPDLVKKLNELAAQEERRANASGAERLRQLAREAGAMLF